MDSVHFSFSASVIIYLSEEPFLSISRTHVFSQWLVWDLPSYLLSLYESLRNEKLQYFFFSFSIIQIERDSLVLGYLKIMHISKLIIFSRCILNRTVTQGFIWTSCCILYVLQGVGVSWFRLKTNACSKHIVLLQNYLYNDNLVTHTKKEKLTCTLFGFLLRKKYICNAY